MMNKIYTVNFTKHNGRPGWTSVWATNIIDARKVIQKRADVQTIVKVVPNG